MRRNKALAKDKDETLTPLENHYSSTLLVTENNNNVKPPTSPTDASQLDVRPKHPSIYHSSPDAAANGKTFSTRSPPTVIPPIPFNESQTQVHQSRRQSPSHFSPDSKSSKTQTRLKNAQPNRSPMSKSGKETTGKESCSSDDYARARLKAYMTKLSLTDEPTAYERTLLGQGRKQEPPDSTLPLATANSQLYRSMRVSKTPSTNDAMYRSMRWSKSFDS